MAAPQIALTGSIGVPGSASLTGYLAITIPDSDYTLSSNEWAHGYLKIVGTLTAPRKVIAPLNPGQQFIVNNASNMTIIVGGTTGNSVSVSSGTQVLTSTDGTDYTAPNPPISGTAGGDLSGSYPNPTVVKVNGAAVPTNSSYVGTSSSGTFVTAAQPLIPVNNLSDVVSVSQSRVNLGLGNMALQNANAIAVSGGTIDGTAIGGSVRGAGFFTDLRASAQIRADQPLNATSSNNYNSPPLVVSGTYWTGSASNIDQWYWQVGMGAGTNPAAVYNLIHNGTSGALSVRMNYTVNMDVADAATGFRLNGTAVSGTYLRGNGTNYVAGTIQSGDLPVASTSTYGAVKPDGTTIVVSGGLLSAVGAAPSGTAGGDLSGTYPNPTVAQVNGAAVPTSIAYLATNGSGQLTAAAAPLVASNNLSDVPNKSTARTNMGLGSVATQNSNAVTITGGTIRNTPIDDTVIGATNPAAGTFTTFSATGAGTFGGYVNTPGIQISSAAPLGYYLRGDGTAYRGVPLQIADVTALGTLSNNTTGSAGSLSGTVAIVNGGTGATSASAARSNLGLGDMATQNSSSIAIGAAEIGSTSTANIPYLDFHSSGFNNDYDSRIMGTGGNATSGNGTLTIIGILQTGDASMQNVAANTLTATGTVAAGSVATNSVSTNGIAVNGIMQGNSVAAGIRATNTSTAFVQGQDYTIIARTGGITVTLPASTSSTGVIANIINDQISGAITVACSGTDLIQYLGSGSHNLGIGGGSGDTGLTFQSDGQGTWYVIGSCR